MAPIAPKAPRLVLVTLALVFVATVTSLMALFVVGKLLGNLSPVDSLLPA